MKTPSNPKKYPRKKAVVAVVFREEKMLVIRRSEFVVAPGKLCFPGGGSEPGENESETIARELKEELNVTSKPKKCLWKCTTPWETEVAWWHVEIESEEILIPDPKEVAEVFWMTVTEMLNQDELLESNRQFLQAWKNQEIII